jgi:hypothetical protein
MIFRNRKMIALAAMLGVAGTAIAASPTLILTGRVEAVSQSEHFVVVLGKRVYTTDTNRFVAGQLVNVYGTRSSDGSIRNASLESSSTYSIGGDQIFVNGTLTAVDAAKGLAYIDGVAVDLAQLQAVSGAKLPSVGSQIQVGGSVSPATGLVAVKRAIISGGSNEAAIISGGSNEEAIISGGSNEAAIISGGSNEAAIISGGSNEAAIISGGSNEAAIISGGSNEAAIISGGSADSQ